MSDQKLKVHFSWLFFPFHRMYLYFFERILGSLIDDPNFAIPFWNWDSPDGMTIPQIYVPYTSPLYDVKRNQDHLPPNLVDLNFGSAKEVTGNDVDESYKRELIKSNLAEMYREMVQAKNASLFHGDEYRSGCKSVNDPGCKPELGGGSVELGSHTAIHKWVGSPKTPNTPFKEDMGNFYSAGYDPLFYGHHANVDRMWSIWKTLPGKRPGKKRSDFDDSDWLDSSFLFYDENANLVRAKVAQFVDTRKLKYDYQNVDIPWLRSRPTPRRRGEGRGRRRRGERKEENTVYSVAFPDKLVRIEVPRPKKPKTKFGEDEKEEALLIQNIKLDQNDSVKFDVCINDEDDGCSPQDSEFAGSFTNIAHGKGGSQPMPLTTNLTLSISELLEDLKCEDDDSITVTLVPREGEVTVGNIKIVYI